MSHYTVAVIVDKLDENEVAKMLAPYQENNMGDCPREYLAFNSITEEYKKTYEEGTRAMILIDDNKLVSEYDDMFKKEIVEEGHCFPTTTYEVPEKYRKVEIPYKLLNLRQAVIKENDLYNEIKDFLKENSNDWKAINKGIEKYGNEFTINGYTKSKQYDEKDTKIDKEMVI